MTYEVPLAGPNSGLGCRPDLQDVVTSAYIILAIEIQKLIKQAHRIGISLTTMMTKNQNVVIVRALFMASKNTTGNNGQ